MYGYFENLNSLIISQKLLSSVCSDFFHFVLYVPLKCHHLWLDDPTFCAQLRKEMLNKDRFCVAQPAVTRRQWHVTPSNASVLLFADFLYLTIYYRFFWLLPSDLILIIFSSSAFRHEFNVKNILNPFLKWSASNDRTVLTTYVLFSPF